MRIKGKAITDHAGRHAAKLLRSTSIAALALLCLPAAAVGQDRHWDANRTAVGNGGTGIWDLSGLIWSPSSDGVSGPYSTPWDNAALDNAIFGGTAGTVTLGAPITVHNITFNTNAYILTGNILTLGGLAPTITTSSTATINSVIAGSSGLTKAGAGTLALTGVNLFTGGIALNTGGISANTDTALGAAGNNIVTGAGASVGLTIGGAGTSRTVTIGNGGTLSLAGSGVGSALITGNGNVYMGSGGVTLSNDANTYTGSTTFRGCNGICSFSFTSIGDLGQASALGAPTTVSDGTIIYNQTSQYSDNVIYTGSGDSSNRDWRISGGAALIRNRGTGTLSLTGNMTTAGGTAFYAETADIALLGVISGNGSLSLAGSAGRTITLGTANTYLGQTTVGSITAAVSVLTDSGTASSVGAGSVISLGNGGTLRYTGAAASSNRNWVSDGATAILNDGIGALTLTGPLAFTAGGVDTLTLGGSFAGTNRFAGVISGVGNLVSTGPTTWVLDGANSYTGSVTVNGGTLRAGSASAFGSTTGFTVNGGTLDLNGYDVTAPSLAGSGGTIALGDSMLTVKATTAQSYGGSIAGSGGLTKAGAGTLTLTGANSYTGATTVGAGALILDFSSPRAPNSDILSSASVLTMSGGTLRAIGAASKANSQRFNGVIVTAGSNTIHADADADGSMDLNLGAITRTGGLINFALPTSGSVMTTNADGRLGGWATINGSDYAKVVGGSILAFDETDYTTKDDASSWANGDIISDTTGLPDTPFFGTVGDNVQLGGLRYTAAANSTVTISAGHTLGVDGTIIVAPSTLATDQVIIGGFLTGGAGGGTLGLQQNGSGVFTIASTIVDNGGAINFVKGGTGTLVLAGANNYTGATTLTAGTLRVNSIGNGGIASGIGASTNASSNLMLEGGELEYTGATATTDRGFTFVNGGASRTINITNGATNLAFTGQVTSPDNAGFTKVGAGTLTLLNAGNDYVGVTTVNSGTLAVGTLANGGLASSIGAASSDSANIVLAGGTLAYLGGTTSSDRGMTLGAGNGGVGVTNAGSTLTLTGILTGTGGLRKEGPGTLVLTKANTYQGGTAVNDGILRAGAVNVFGSGAMAVKAGARLELNNFNNAVNGLSGAGTVSLGTATLTVNNSGTFTGTISGTGGLTRAGNNQYVLTLSGCNNTYTGVTTITNSTTLQVDCLANGGMASGIGASSNASSNLSIGVGVLAYTGGNVTTDRGITLSGGVGAIGVSNAATTLEFSGNIVGGGGLRKDGAGMLVLSGVNTSTGNAQITGGTLLAKSTRALGTGALTINNAATAQLDLDGFSNSVAFLAGGGAVGGNISLGNATLTINAGSSLASANYGGAISGSGALIKNGASIQQLSGCNSSYTGVTTVNAGTLAVACLTDGGLNSSIGSSTSGANNLILNGGTLQYVGAAGSTNRAFTLGPSATSKLNASGTGAISFTSTAAIAFSNANTAQTLTLGGTNIGNNQLAAQITNNGTGATSLTKTDAGTWILTNPDSDYTGITTISGGVLGVSKLADGGEASSIGASSAAASNLIIGKDSTLRYTGTGDTTNRLFTLSSGVTYIESAGTGAIVFTDTGPVTLQGNNQARTIALGGTNTGNNTLAGAIGNAGTGVTTLAKNDSGTWVLTGNHSYTGSTNVNAGTLFIGGGGTTGSIASGTINNFGTLAFNRADSLTYGGEISGTGGVDQMGAGTTILTGANSYTGGTAIKAGTLQLGNGGASGSIAGNVANDGLLVFNRSGAATFGGVISGSGAVRQQGSGTTILSGVNSYGGGTSILAGTLQVSADANLGAAAGALRFNGGTLRTSASFTSARNATLAGAGTILTDTGTSFMLGGALSGPGGLTKTGAGALILTGNGNNHMGGTTIAAGALQLGNGGTSGFLAGDVVNEGSLIFRRSDNIGFGGLVTGTGSVTQNGAGIVTLTANNGYTGATFVNAGTLRINGNQSAATGLTNVAAGAALGGTGTIGGDVTIADGGILAPGDSVGTLTIAGNLSLSGGSLLNFDFGAANMVGGGLNDLVDVGGNLVLNGTVNVSVSDGGSFGAGIYRMFNYGGTLTDNILDIGMMPAGSAVAVQTSVAGQVNLVNTAGAPLNFWDGDAGPKSNGVVNGGNGLWQSGTGNDNWTDATGSANAAYDDGTFAIFAGVGGAVIVDNSGGPVTASGMQFAANGYSITGNALTLTDAQSTIRVGDGTATGAGFTTTIAAQLAGAAQLVKTDLGTLVLTGTNSYTGGTAINGGTLRIAGDANLGAAAGGLSFSGGTLNTTTTFTTGRAVTLVGAGTLLTNAGTTLTLFGDVTGGGALTKSGTGTLVLTGSATHGGGSTVAAGTLQIGNGGTTGSIAGDIFNNGALTFNRANDLSYAGAVSGTGTLTKLGTGTLTITGLSSYIGTTTVDSGKLVLQSGGQINGTSTFQVGSTATAEMVVDGPGSQLVAGSGTSYIGRSGAGTLTIQNGGVVSLGIMAVAGNAGSSGTINIIGTGSRLTNSGSGIGLLNNTIGLRELGTLNIGDGGTMTSTGASFNVGFASGAISGRGAVNISGAGSRWDLTGALDAYNGAITLTDGGVLTAASARLAFNLNTAMDLLVSGAGSRFETSNALTLAATATGVGTITIADGGVVRVGGGTLAMGPGNAALNIGGVEGGAAAHAGTLDATAVTFGAAGNRINFNHDDASYTFSAAISGAGTVNQNGPGNTVLTGANSYGGDTVINLGGLYINGDQSGAIGTTRVHSNGTLGGTGTIGGHVSVDGGALNPGALGTAPGTLTINGNLDLSAGSTLNVGFGQANVVGGALNDLIEVRGDLILGGTLNVRTVAGGSFDPGIYRVISYDGTLTDNGIAIGTIPSPDFYVQTSIANQVNLLNTAGLTFRYWDGPLSKNNGVIDGGNGLWQNSTGNDNWVDDGSVPNAPFADNAFAVFMGAAGEVTVDESLGDVTAGGMQFLTDGYVLGGDAITLVGAQAVIRTGDGTAAGAGITATIDAALTGDAQLAKSDLGTLILTGFNSYTGGTAINGGILQISADANLGAAAGGLSFDGGTLRTMVDITSDRAVTLAGNGMLLTEAGTTLGLTGTISGAGGLVKDGAGTLVLTGDNSYAGRTLINAGMLVVNGDQSAATGLTGIGTGATLAGNGTLGGHVTIADGGTLAPGNSPGTLTIAGNLALSAGSILDFEFGEAGVAGGAFNDLINVGGDLVLDGTLNVSVSAGGAFGAGIYRVLNYGGTLTNNGLSLGLLPGGSTTTIQTAIAGQVNLVNTAGLTLNFWDGDAGPKFDNIINGGNGVWQSSAGDDSWTDATGGVNAGYADGAMAIFAGTGGQVTIDNGAGVVSAAGLQFAADGYEIRGETLTLTGPQATIRVDESLIAGAGFTATIASELAGATQLVKTDAGTLILSGANSYTGGTAIEGGTLAIAADANLGDGAGGLSLSNGTLRTMASLTSDRAVALTGAGTILADAGATFTLNGLLSGGGALTKDGAGTLVLTGDNGGYGAATRIAGGTLAVDGTLGSIVTVAQAGRLEGTGQVSGIVNSGVVVPGRGGIGTFTVAGDYVGNGGTLAIETTLDDDGSQTSRLVVNGATSGTTQVSVTNRGGVGAPTVAGIKIIDVAGASNGTFTLNGDYLFQGEQAVVAGAYGYRLYQGGVADPADGDWYLRSSLLNPGEPNEPGSPIYQPGVPVYEAYGQTLLALNSLPTMQQRVGNRSWSGSVVAGAGIWGRMEGTRARPEAAASTSGINRRTDSWKVQMGADTPIQQSAKGSLIAGVTAHYGEAKTNIASLFGAGSIDAKGYGFGAALTWYEAQGFYADGQAQVSWYDSDLTSDTLGRLTSGNRGRGEAFSVEAGKRASLSDSLTLTPQIQMAYSTVTFDQFSDPANASISASQGDSLKSRGGISLDYQAKGADGGQTHLYGVVNLNYEWLDGNRTDVSGISIANRDQRLWGELGLGGSHSWADGKISLYGELSANTSFRSFGDSYTLKANAGARIRF